jgi:hypothetical protein
LLSPESFLKPPRVEEMFGYAKIKLFSFADLYAGKLVAADRQYPRDQFDVATRLTNESIEDPLRFRSITLFLAWWFLHPLEDVPIQALPTAPQSA